MAAIMHHGVAIYAINIALSIIVPTSCIEAVPYNHKGLTNEFYTVVFQKEH